MRKIEEFDTSPIAWEIYKLMYGNNFEKEKFEISYDSRKIIKDICFKYNGKCTKHMNFSGETDFNFGRGWSHTRYEKYEKIIIHSSITPQKYKTMYSNYLDICNKLYRSIVNISIMPQTGNLQSIKKGIGNDRIDTFIWALDEYYSKNSNILTNNCTFENINALKSYLDIFGNAKNYCGAIYHISESLVDELIVSGKEPIDSVERMISYMNLALRFWRQKIAYIKKQSSQSEEISQAIKTADGLLEEIFT